uniref:Uncharacterized protein n=1 Tax=Cebus imitator TaxID=2715852 RepID=A0A2K5S3Z9_CEBIM
RGPAQISHQARELESREAELRRRDTFYKEQLGHIERKNAEMYKLSSQQFHEAASKMESTINTRCSRVILSFLCPSPGVSHFSQLPHSFCWRMLLEATLWGLGSGCAPCYGSVIASRCSQWEELGNTDVCPAGWSPSAPGCRPRSSSATEIACMRCFCAQTWSRRTSAA